MHAEQTPDQQSESTSDRRDAINERAQTLFNQHLFRLHSQTDRMFVALMILQFSGGVLIALLITPRTWIGATSYLHVHVVAALLLGATLSTVPIFMGLKYPGHASTRHVIAFAQGAWSALLIHLSGGRIETHFHIFGSLAFLAFYRDWRVLLTATLVTTADHFIRGIWWPQSVYGIMLESPFRWIEHAAWVVFEDVFLILSCFHGTAEAHVISERQAELELTNHEIEERVSSRTEQLVKAHTRLAEELANHHETQREREKLQQQLMDSARQAGMADVATGVLHNVGNVLNSINVTTQFVLERLQTSRLPWLKQSCELLNEHQERLGDFLADDPRGSKLPEFLGKLSSKLEIENSQNIDDLNELRGHVDHIKHIVSMQQSIAKPSGLLLPLELQDVINDAIKINRASIDNHSIELIRSFDELPTITSDKHKLLQILVNLIKNAKESICEEAPAVRQINIQLTLSDGNRIVVAITDSGIGFSDEEKTKLFKQGYTTKKEGHGFGLHSSAIAAKEIGGELSATSPGKGQGATFRLSLPLKAPDSAAAKTLEKQWMSHV